MGQVMHHTFTLLLFIPLGLALAAFIIYCNVRYWHDLRKMSPQQRAAFKKEERWENHIW
jgi:hypothetical protein